MRLITPTEWEIVTPEETYHFKAQKPEMADAWVGKLQQMVLQSSKSVQNSESPPDADHGEDHPSILQWPESSGKRALYLTTFPMLLLFFFTIVDGEKCHTCLWPMLYIRTDLNVNTGRGRCLVRRKGKQGYFMLTMFSAVVWLAILAEGMMAAAERVGCMLEIDEDLMGLTVTAAGTSLPNLFASVLVARQGLGNMAVSNAFGSNTFNIFVALGFPWLVATLYLDPGSSYHVDKGHIFGSCMILVGILTMFLMLLGTANMKLTPCIGVIYLITYVLFMGYLVCPKTKHPNPKNLRVLYRYGNLIAPKNTQWNLYHNEHCNFQRFRLPPSYIPSTGLVGAGGAAAPGARRDGVAPPERRRVPSPHVSDTPSFHTTRSCCCRRCRFDAQRSAISAPL